MMNAGRRVKAHISALEQRIVENMLNATLKETSVPTLSTENTIPPVSLASSLSLSPPTSTSPASQYRAFVTLIDSVASQSNFGIEGMFDFMEFLQTVDSIYSSYAIAA